jgi:muconate cycloisomerase
MSRSAAAPIERIEIFAVAVPLVGEGFRNAYLTKTVQKSAVVRVTAVDGDIGLGNIDPSPGYSVETVEQSLHALHAKLAPAVRGLDAANPRRVLAAMDAALSGFLDAKAAIEMACIDLAARRAGMAVHAYLGGALIEQLRFNAWIGILPAAEAAAEASVWVERGFRSAKVKVGGGIEADRERLRAIRDAVGPGFALRADANAGYGVDDAIALGRKLEPFDLQLFEQPVAAGDLEGMAKVRRSVGIPVMADESITDHASLIAVIRAGCADIVKLKVMKQGGLLKCRHMLETAAAAGLRVVIGHGFGLGVNTVAEIMLASTSTAVIEGLECVGPLKTADDIVTHKPDMSRGEMALPGGPGLGVELDEDKLRRYRLDA